ncbi:hypothetical protein GJAV_G00133320 [Gymnothorax javanicus]|nr:hypothetical protein GJAV_G00133320 [Gymnothorax javanicus]
MEELFSHSAAGQSPNERVPPGRGGRGMLVTAQTTETIFILNAKRSMNIGIFLKQFKRPMTELLKDIQLGKWTESGTGKLRELSKHLPEEEEVKRLLAFRGDLSCICEADLFMVLLVKVPCYEERIRGLVLREEFLPLVEEMKQSISIMTSAAKELLACDDLHSIIRLVLKAGNYMNAGGYAGSAIGFRMTSLLKLVETKANKPSMNLMHYVAMQAQEIDETLLKFPIQLRSIGAAARINKQEVEADFKREVERVKGSKEDCCKHQDLQLQMESFLQTAESILAEVEVSLQALDSASQSVAEFFCEEPSQFKLEECCSIFHSFCEKFMRALQENRERELAEQKRRQRLQYAAKRRSVATCSSLDRDKDLEGVALEYVLEKFLSSRASRRRGVAATTGGGSLTDLGPGKTCRSEPELKLRPLGDGMSRWNSAQDLTASARSGEGLYSPERRERAAFPTIENKTTPKGRDRTRERRRTDLHFYPGGRSSAPSLVEEEEGEKDGEKENDEEEAQRMREVSRRVLRYQTSRENLSPGEYLILDRSPRGASKAATSPRPNDRGTSPPLKTVLSPHALPKATTPNPSPTGPNRHQSLSVHPQSSVSLGDNTDNPTPTVLPRAPPTPLARVGRIRSLDSCHLTTQPPENFCAAPRPTADLPDDPTPRVPSQGPSAVSTTFHLGDLFHKRSSQGSERVKPERQGGSAFVSFFKRLGEKHSRVPATAPLES